jgi:hypothetical protein
MKLQLKQAIVQRIVDPNKLQNQMCRQIQASISEVDSGLDASKNNEIAASWTTDASKPTKTSSREPPELWFVLLEANLNDVSLQAKCQKRVQGKPLNCGL